MPASCPRSRVPALELPALVAVVDTARVRSTAADSSGCRDCAPSSRQPGFSGVRFCPRPERHAARAHVPTELCSPTGVRLPPARDLPGGALHDDDRHCRDWTAQRAAVLLMLVSESASERAGRAGAQGAARAGDRRVHVPHPSPGSAVRCERRNRRGPAPSLLVDLVEEGAGFGGSERLAAWGWVGGWRVCGES
jgi:hypothetical protein